MFPVSAPATDAIFSDCVRSGSRPRVECTRASIHHSDPERGSASTAPRSACSASTNRPASVSSEARARCARSFVVFSRMAV